MYGLEIENDVKIPSNAKDGKDQIIPGELGPG
jgi:hypothetical protein